jgi:WD40 repeat protein
MTAATIFANGELPVSGLARPGSRVLLTGTAHYPAAGELLPDVPAVGRSLTALAEVLRDQCGIGEENLSAPLIDPSDPRELGEAVERVVSEASDTLLVYYAGHGLIGHNQELYLATKATDSQVGGLDYKALSYTALLRLLQGRRPETSVVVVLDCCFSNRGWPAVRLPIDSVFERSLTQGGFLLASAARDEHALAAPDEDYTRFTGALIRLLRDGDPTGPRGLTLDHVYRFLYRTLPDGTPRPHRHSTDRAGELILAPNWAYPSSAEREPDRWRPGDPLSDEGPEVPPCPFPGLRPFSREDAGHFFGRDDLIQKVTQCVNGPDRLHAVIGPSGSGKTSLLHAGAIPRLQDQGWKVAVMEPGGDPLGRLVKLEEALSGPGELVVIDQFEELFASEVPENDRKRFLQRLAGLPTAVVALRADFYGQCLRYPELVRALQKNQIIVGPMDAGNLRQMIYKSAKTARLRLEDGLVDTLLNEVGLRETHNQAAALPLLSHALQETWLRRSGNLLTLAGYRATGGIENAIGQEAQKIYKNLDADGKSRMRDLLLRMVRLGDDAEDTRRQLPLAQLTDPDRRILDALAGARLAVIGDDEAELAHDAMLYSWPQLQEWIKDDRTALLTASQLEDAARAWQQAGGGDEYLYPGTRLNTVKNILESAKTTLRLGESAQRFMKASWDRHRAEQQAARRRQQRRRAVLSVICALVLAAGTVGVIAAREGQDAARSAAITQANNLAADAASLVPVDPGLAAQLAVAAYRTSPTPSASSQLYASLQTPLDQVLSATGSGVLRIAAQSHGPLAAAVDSDRSLRIWDVPGGGKPVLESTVHTVGDAAITLAPSRALLAGECPDRKALCLWNLSDPRHPALLASLSVPPGTRGITSMAISDDGTLLAAAAEQGLTLVWSISNPRRPQRVAVLPNPTTDQSSGLPAVTFSPHANLLAQTIQHGTTQLWNMSNPHAPVKQATIPAGYRAIAFSPDGTLLSAVGGTSIGLWKVADPAHPVPVNTSGLVDGTPDDMTSVAFSRDGAWLAYGGTDIGRPQSALCLVDLSPASLDAIGGADSDCTPTGFDTYTMAYTGSTILTAGTDGDVRLWRQPLPQTRGMDIGGSFSWGISPDGRLLAAILSSPGSDFPASAIGIWENSGPSGLVREATITLTAQAQVIQFIRPDGLVTVAADGTVQLWNLKNPRRPVSMASLGKDAFAGSGDVITGTGVSADDAGDLIGVQGGDSLNLWQVSGSLTARQAGSLPIGDPKADVADILDDHTALIITRTGITWWNITNPSSPRQGTVSSLPGADQGDMIGSGDIAAATTTLTATGSSLKLFGVDDGLVRSSVPLPGPAGGFLGLSSDNRLLAAGGPGDDTVRLWDISNPARPADKAVISTLQQTVGFTFGPADRLMADWTDNQVQLWNLGDPSNPVQVGSITPPSQASSIEDAAFTPTGTTLAIANGDSVILYDTDPAHLASQLCTYTGGITAAQWTQYAPGIPYQNPCHSN